MSSVHIRPRFQMRAAGSAAEVLARIRQALEQPGAAVRGTVSAHHALLRIPDPHSHFWSPRLTVEVLEIAPQQSELRCLFAPAPAVWTLFVAIYAAVGFGGLVALIWGLSACSLGMDAGVLWLVPVALLLGLTAWLTAAFGQRLGRDQMVVLREFLEKALAESSEP